MDTMHMSYHHVDDIIREMTTNTGKRYVRDLYSVSDTLKQMIRRWEGDFDFNEYLDIVKEDIFIAMHKIRQLIGEDSNEEQVTLKATTQISDSNSVTISKDHYDLLVRLANFAMERME